MFTTVAFATGTARTRFGGPVTSMQVTTPGVTHTGMPAQLAGQLQWLASVLAELAPGGLGNRCPPPAGSRADLRVR